jgi:hypothetical protein
LNLNILTFLSFSLAFIHTFLSFLSPISPPIVSSKYYSSAPPPSLSVEGLYCKSPIQCLASSNILEDARHCPVLYVRKYFVSLSILNLFVTLASIRLLTPSST